MKEATKRLKEKVEEIAKLTAAGGKNRRDKKDKRKK